MLPVPVGSQGRRERPLRHRQYDRPSCRFQKRTLPTERVPVRLSGTASNPGTRQRVHATPHESDGAAKLSGPTRLQARSPRLLHSRPDFRPRCGPSSSAWGLRRLEQRVGIRSQARRVLLDQYIRLPPAPATPETCRTCIRTVLLPADRTSRSSPSPLNPHLHRRSSEMPKSSEAVFRIERPAHAARSEKLSAFSRSAVVRSVHSLSKRMSGRSLESKTSERPYPSEPARRMSASGPSTQRARW